MNPVPKYIKNNVRPMSSSLYPLALRIFLPLADRYEVPVNQA
jgi:hypothetical protein